MFINGPFLHTATSGDEDYCHKMGLCQLLNAALFVLTHLEIRTRGLSGATSHAGFTEEACCLNDVTSVKFQLCKSSVQTLK